LIGNGLRCVGIILLAHFTNNEYGAGADHIVYGWGFNVAILLFLIFLGSRFRDDAPAPAPAAPRQGRKDTPQALGAALAVTAILISVGPAYAWWRDTRPAQPDMTATASLLQAGGWQKDAETSNWQPQFPGADASVKMMLAQNDIAEPVELFIGYYARPRTGHTATAHLNQAWNDTIWNPASNATITAALGKSPVLLQETLINSGMEKRLVWSTYWVDGKFTPSVLRVKLLQTKGVIEGHEGQAFVALSTPVNGPMEDARVRLNGALSSLGQLSGTLDRADTPPAPGGGR
jgi:EpsI family protein